MPKALRDGRGRHGKFLKLVMEKLEASFSSLKGERGGHFVAIAVGGSEPKKFIIRLELLYDPEFLELLKQAEEIFGFNHEGALAIPCKPEELEKIIRAKEATDQGC